MESKEDEIEANANNNSNKDASDSAMSESLSENNDSNSKDDPFRSISQKDYEPTPYFPTKWEGIEKFDLNATFQSMSLDVLVDENFKHDSMFEVFHDVLDSDKFKQIDDDKKKDTEEEEKQQIGEEELKAAREEGFKEGYDKGRSEGIKKANEKISSIEEDVKIKLEEFSKNISEKFEEKTATIESNALQLALSISKKILDTTTELRSDYIYELISKALGSTKGAKSIVIKLGNKDFEFIKNNGLPDEIKNSSVSITYKVDDNISSGCVVESEYGLLNLEIDNMWDEVANSLYSLVEK